MMTKSEKQRIRIGAIGTGGRLAAVLRVLCEADSRVEIVALSDPDPSALAYCCERLKLPAGLERSAADILADPEVDWVFIGSPNCFHAEQVIAALDAGKHVFCEKPLATTMEVAERLQQAGQRNQQRFFALGLVLRYAPVYQEIHKVIASGKLGQIISLEFNETLRPGHGGYIHGNWRRNRELAGTHLLEKCCHDIDLCLWLTGSLPQRAASFGGLNFFIPENAPLYDRYTNKESGESLFNSWRNPYGVNPFTAEKSIIDNQVVIMEFYNGIRATFHTNCSSTIPERRFYIIGSEGTLRADAITGVIEYQSIDPEQEREVIDSGYQGGHAGGDEAMARHLVRTLFEGVEPAAGMTEGIESLVTVCGIDEAMDSGEVFNYDEVWKSLSIDPLARDCPVASANNNQES